MLRVERFNVADEAGRRVYEALGASGVPTTVLFDAVGREAYREERTVPRPREIRAALAGSTRRS